MNILVVENQTEWRMALKSMYLGALGQGSHAVDVASSVPEAIQAMKARPYDVLSLDINMTQSQPQETASARVDACGLDVLDYAHEKKRAQAVIVISGCTWDTELTWVVDGKEEEDEIRTNIAGILERTFGRRGRFFPKPDPVLVSVETTISVWRNTITRRFLESLAEGGLLPRPYRMTVKLKGGWPSDIIVAAAGSNEVRSVPKEGIDFIWLLIMQWIDGGKGVKHKEAAVALLGRAEAERRLAKYEAGGEYADRSDSDRLGMMQRSVNGYVSSFKERLRDIGIEPDGIIVNWGPGGWCRARDLDISGLSSVKETSAGHSGGAFDPTSVVLDGGGTPDDLVAAEETEEIRDHFLQYADSEQKRSFGDLSTEQQEAVLDLFVQHERRWKARRP